MSIALKKKDLIYFYAIQGYAATKIKDFKDIACSKAYVSKIINQHIKNGYLIEIKERNEKGQLRSKKPKLYGKTNKAYPSKLTNFTSRALTTPTEQPRLNLVTTMYVIKEPLATQPENDKEEKITVHSWIGANNVKFIDVKKIFDIGRITIRVVNEKRLIVFMPEFFRDPTDLRHSKQILFGKAQEYCTWFCRKYGCRVGLPELYEGDPHIAIGERDPFLMELSSKYGMIKLIDHEGNTIDWWDSSKGYFEFETRLEKQAEIKAFMPVIVENLQDRVFKLQSEIESLCMLIEGFETKIERLIDSTERLNRLFINEEIEDTYEGYA